MTASSGARTGRLGELVGRRREELPTPALLLDLDRARANIAALAGRLPTRVRHRPHTKIHKCAQLAAMQIEGGARGVTVATVHEAAALIERGFDDVLIANEVVGPEKLGLVAELARRARVSVAVDDERHVQSLSGACAERGATIGVMIDVDVGVGRCGVRTADEAVVLATRVAEASALELAGVMGYEGHAMLIADLAERRAVAGRAYERLGEVVSAVRSHGFELATVSAGGTGTYELATASGLINEIRAGSYVVMDGSYAPIVPEFGVAATVLATVISRKGGSIVVDCGAKAIDVALELPSVVGAEATPRYFAEEHLVYDVPAGSALEVGSTVELMPAQCGPTVNLHVFHHVLENGVVVDLWPVLARGVGYPAPDA